ncbi:uncharacterized protein A4U43_C10F1200 [Asparagus officinalis]|uniref:Uncharacterized protein n=1 Tax=Asparagus officinalis TaxID=4686 RepID=A0A5P1E088_ASPOF|nr:uncharacterized protein A4U43_C10F1200 [Asparagus officinalis]
MKGCGLVARRRRRKHSHLPPCRSALLPLATEDTAADRAHRRPWPALEAPATGCHRASPRRRRRPPPHGHLRAPPPHRAATSPGGRRAAGESAWPAGWTSWWLDSEEEGHGRLVREAEVGPQGDGVVCLKRSDSMRIVKGGLALLLARRRLRARPRDAVEG